MCKDVKLFMRYPQKEAVCQWRMISAHFSLLYYLSILDLGHIWSSSNYEFIHLTQNCVLCYVWKLTWRPQQIFDKMNPLCLSHTKNPIKLPVTIRSLDGLKRRWPWLVLIKIFIEPTGPNQLWLWQHHGTDYQQVLYFKVLVGVVITHFWEI